MLENLDWFSWVLLPLIVFATRVLDVTLGTMRIIFLSRGRRYLAPLLGFVEVLIWIAVVARSLRADELHVETIVTGSIPAQTIIDTSKDNHVDLIMMTSRGRGRLKSLFVGSVAEQVVEGAESMVFMMPVPDEVL